MYFSTFFSSFSISTTIELNWWKWNILIYYYVKRWLLNTGQKNRPHIYKNNSEKDNQVHANLTQDSLSHCLYSIILSTSHWLTQLTKIKVLSLLIHFQFLVKQPSFLSPLRSSMISPLLDRFSFSACIELVNEMTISSRQTLLSTCNFLFSRTRIFVNFVA